MVQNQSNLQNQPGLSWLSGTCAGFAGTLPMTIFMLLTQRFLPRDQRYDLPPEIITKELASRAHVRHHMNKIEVLVATTFSHFGYGAALGSLYAPLLKRLPLPGIIKGMLFGLFIWAGSYFGLLPLLGMSESGHREPGRRNIMMIAAHLIWGSSMGLITDFLTRS
jgi:uncharacterized membrane protein YagU involved in acid resistance